MDEFDDSPTEVDEYDDLGADDAESYGDEASYDVVVEDDGLGDDDDDDTGPDTDIDPGTGVKLGGGQLQP